MFNPIVFKSFVGKDVELTYDGKFHLSPIILTNFDYGVYPQGTIFFYSDNEDVLHFHSEEVKNVETKGDDFWDTISITFMDDLYIIIGSEVK